MHCPLGSLRELKQCCGPLPRSGNLSLHGHTFRLKVLTDISQVDTNADLSTISLWHLIVCYLNFIGY